MASSLLARRSAGSMALVAGRPANQRRKRTGAAILVYRASTSLQAAPAAEPSVRRQEQQVAEDVSEVEWLASTDPGALCNILGYLQYHAGYRISERKWRWFAVACVRRVAHVFKDWRTTRLLDAVDQFADGVIGEQELYRLWMLAGDPPSQDGGDPDDCPPEQRGSACAGTALGVAAT